MERIELAIAEAEATVQDAMADLQFARETGNRALVKAAFAMVVAAERDLDAVYAVRDYEVATRAAVLAYS